MPDQLKQQMKKYSFLILFLFARESLFCQDVIISGTNKNRTLTWDDFTGKPDKSSPFDAHTYWNVNYRYKRVVYVSDTAKIEEPVVILELNKNLSWIKPGRETPKLLKHEQGHFNIGLLCQKELIDKFKTTTFTRSDFRDKIQLLFKTILDKYTAMGIKYDDETDHGKNPEKQESWNDFFSGELKTGNSL